MHWLELTVEADVEAVEAVSEIFGRLGRGAAVRPTRLITDPGDELATHEDPSAPYLVTAHVPSDDEAPDAVDRTRRALWHLQAFGLRPVGELQVREVDGRDWAEAWKAGYAPQRIGRIVIIPSWLDEKVAEGELPIRLDPGMAFGTGLHPTTRGCLTLLQELGPMPARVLDLGSGSGILGIASLRLGAERVVAYDTDPIAVEATLANAAANELGDRVEAHRGTLPPAPVGGDAPYPLVLANLVASVLVELAPALASWTVARGTLVASGIIDSRAEQVVTALQEAGFATVERLDEGDWVSLRLARHA